jgi:hypothetical protein
MKKLNEKDAAMRIVINDITERKKMNIFKK